MDTPRIPNKRKGQPFRAKDYNQIQRAINSLGRSVKADSAPNIDTIRERLPFQPYRLRKDDTDWKVTIENGFVQDHGKDNQILPTVDGTNIDNDPKPELTLAGLDSFNYVRVNVAAGTAEIESKTAELTEKAGGLLNIEIFRTTSAGGGSYPLIELKRLGNIDLFDRGRFKLVSASSTTVNVLPGVVYEQNPKGDSGNKPTLFHWPTIGGTAINASPAPALTVANGDYVYLKIETTENGLITAATIEASGTEQQSTHHDPPTQNTSGQTGTYYVLLATISISSGVVTPSQVWESDLWWTVDGPHVDSSGTGIETVEKIEDGSWYHKRIQDDPSYLAPTSWNEDLTPANVGVRATDNTTSVQLTTDGTTCIISFVDCNGSEVANLQFSKGLLYSASLPAGGEIELGECEGTTVAP